MLTAVTLSEATSGPYMNVASDSRPEPEGTCPGRRDWVTSEPCRLIGSAVLAAPRYRSTARSEEKALWGAMTTIDRG